MYRLAASDSRDWHRISDSLSLGHKKVFAPANLRCAAQNEAYRALVHSWISERYTLRYSGGMVPDVHHALVKVRLKGLSLAAMQAAGWSALCGAQRGTHT